MSGQSDKAISVGKISGVFGVKGWVKVFSYTDPMENILNYSPWTLIKGDDIRTCKMIDGRVQGKTIVAQLEGLTDRDQAASLMGFGVFIQQRQLPKTREGEYYWADLIGLNVKTLQGIDLGIVDSLMETGANDVLLVRGKRERAIPFLQGQTVLAVDLKAGAIIVDWDPEF